MIAATALVTSVSSIAIALRHGHFMAMLVQANSLPYLQGGFSDTTAEDIQVISLDLLNRGVGPAHEPQPVKQCRRDESREFLP